MAGLFCYRTAKRLPHTVKGWRTFLHALSPSLILATMKLLRIVSLLPPAGLLLLQMSCGGGDASGHAGFIHVGLGTAERAEIRVQWPDGDQSPSYRVFANQFVVVDRTKPQAAYWYPGR